MLEKSGLQTTTAHLYLPGVLMVFIGLAIAVPFVIEIFQVISDSENSISKNPYFVISLLFAVIILFAGNGLRELAESPDDFFAKKVRKGKTKYDDAMFTSKALLGMITISFLFFQNAAIGELTYGLLLFSLVCHFSFFASVMYYKRILISQKDVTS